MMTMKKKIMTMMLMALCGIAVAEAQPHRGLHPVVINPRPMRVTKVVSNQSDRLEMAIAYIKSHGSINAKQYSKITGLNKATAEAELDAFATRRCNPIVIQFNGKKKTYVLA
mgnify:CR=1 FL=1